MSVLDKNTIQKYLEDGKIAFSPELVPEQMQPHSIDLRLGYEFHIPRVWSFTDKGREIIQVDIDKENNNFEKLKLKKEQYFEIAPGEFIIGSTLEKIELNTYDIMGVLYPRSSVNRRGLSVDLTGIIDTGYHGRLFIPIKNTTQSQIIKIHPEERFVQVVFSRLVNELTKQEAMKHGTKKPKYHQKTSTLKFEFKPDER
jgi:dCTP deaminase